MYEIWKLYAENYPSYCVRTKVLTKFSCDLDLLTQNVLVSSSYHLASMYEICTLKTTQVIVSEPKCWRTDRQTDGRTNLISIRHPSSGGALINLKSMSWTNTSWHLDFLNLIVLLIWKFRHSLTKKNYTKIYVTYTWNILHIYVSYMYSLCRYMLAICICYIYVKLGPTYMWHILNIWEVYGLIKREENK